jgi:S1-C subfamily serine protease
VTLGDDVVISGYPLNVPGMVTHRGMISGMTADTSLFFIEAPINKGNSGGALVDKNGNIIGLLSLREGGLSPALEDLRRKIYASMQSGMTITMAGINPVTSTGMLIDTVDQYISVGIGYARSAMFAKQYMAKHPDMAK